MPPNPVNAGDGEVWINKSGQVGQGSYSAEALRADAWYRIVFRADLARGERTYFVDGRPVLRQADEKLDGRFALYSVDAEQPFFTLFADGNGESAPIDVRQVALWNHALPDAAVAALGGPGTAIGR
jgi:hypothetical protein